MGWATHWFVNEINPNDTCYSCTQVLKNTFICNKCRNRFCKECLNGSSVNSQPDKHEKAKKCP